MKCLVGLMLRIGFEAVVVNSICIKTFLFMGMG